MTVKEKQPTLDRNYIYTALITAVIFIFFLTSMFFSVLYFRKDPEDSIIIDYDLGKYENRLKDLEVAYQELEEIVLFNKEMCSRSSKDDEELEHKLKDISEILEATNNNFNKLIYKVERIANSQGEEE